MKYTKCIVNVWLNVLWTIVGLVGQIVCWNWVVNGLIIKIQNVCNFPLLKLQMKMQKYKSSLCFHLYFVIMFIHQVNPKPFAFVFNLLLLILLHMFVNCWYSVCHHYYVSCLKVGGLKHELHYRIPYLLLLLLYFD